MNYVKKVSISLGFILSSILILCFLTTLLSYFDVFKNNVINIIKIIIPCFSLLLGGFIIGKQSNQKGWLEGLKLSFIFLIFLVLFDYLGLGNKLEIKNLLYFTILIISCIFGSMIGISKKKTS